MNRGRRVIVALGRSGDILNILPMVLHEHQLGHRPLLCVAKEFEGLLDGISYCDRLVYPGLYNEPAKAHRWIQQQVPGEPLTIAQAYRHPFDNDRRTSSYQTESWRVAGQLSEFGKHPLVFDRRDFQREAILSRLGATEGRDHVLMCLEGISSPFSRANEVAQAIIDDAKYVVWDISRLRAERIYDMISVYEKSVCLVSVDTMHLHLARAAKVPVIALTNNGFFGSIPPPGAVATFRYGEDGIAGKVRQSVDKVLDAKNGHRFVVHACDMHGHSDRHIRAQSTWDAALGEESIIECHADSWGQTALEIGDPRNLPKLGDILKAAFEKTTSDSDVVIFHNSDVALEPGCVAKMRVHAATFGAFSIRRVEPGANYTHVGRELWGFRVDWLARNLKNIPPFYVGAPYFDIILAAIIRKEHGIVTTRENLGIDFYPCEMSPGSAIHEMHQSNWAGEQEHHLPANLWNRRLAIKWAMANCPSLEI